MVEKTIFIVKPIYVPIEVSRGKAAGDNMDSIGGGSLTAKKKLKLKKKVQKAIYMERPKPPNYTNPMSTALADKKARKKASIERKRGSQVVGGSIGRSPSPFSSSIPRGQGVDTQMIEALNQSSVD